MRYFILVLITLINLTTFSYSQTVTVDGFVRLQNQTDNSNIAVIFHRTAPNLSCDTLFTDINGYFKTQTDIGIYEIVFQKQRFFPDTLKDLKVFDDKHLDTITLKYGVLTGNISGFLSKGDYFIKDTLTILDGDSLIIEHGARLFFKKNSLMKVNGFLYAIGTETDSITFTRQLELGDSPDSSYWGGISITKQTNDNNLGECAVLKYCHISYCTRAIFINYSITTISHVLISDCLGPGVLITSNCVSNIKNVKIMNIGRNELEYTSIPHDHCLEFVASSGTVENVEICNVLDENMGIIGFLWSTRMILNNLLIHDNHGWIVYFVYDSDLSFNNCTFVNDTKGLVYGVGVTFNNCIFANCPKLAFEGAKVLNSSLFDVPAVLSSKDKWIGVNVRKNKKGDSCDVYGNILLDPKFIDYSNHDYSLSSASPCIDAGNNDSVTISRDFAGNARIWDGNMDGDSLVDMGAFEFGAPLMKIKSIINENFESGKNTWGNQSSAPDRNWKVAELKKDAHSGQYCLYLSGSSNNSDATITTPFVDLPYLDNLILTFWLASSASFITEKDMHTPLYSANNALTVSIKTLKGPGFVSEELLRVPDINFPWKKYQIDLAKYRGQTIGISFNGIINANGTIAPGLALDDIFISTVENTSVEDETFASFNDEISLFPNPASGYITVTIGANGCSPESIKIFDVFGREKHPPTPSYEEGELRVDVSALPPGVYFVRVGNKVQKFVKV